MSRGPPRIITGWPALLELPQLLHRRGGPFARTWLSGGTRALARGVAGTIVRAGARVRRKKS